MSFTLSFREGFLSELLALPAKEQAQVNNKLQALLQDPRPDGVTKKQLKYLDRKVSRLRSGDFRVFYTYDDRYVSLLKVVRRTESTYDEDVDADFFGGPPESQPQNASAAGSYVQRPPRESTSRLLSRALDAEFLNQLQVPREHHNRLAAVSDEDALLSLQGVPDEILLRVHQASFERPPETVLREKELVATTVDDLFRYRDGDFLAFLLRLSAEQEKYVSWALEGSGPTLVKGGPGTGKSTVALYRVRAMLESLKKAGEPAPRVLFTTYTNALVTFSEHLLRSLLGQDARFVDVKTADSIALSIVASRMGSPRIATQQELRQAIQKAMAAVRPEGSSLQKRASVDILSKLGVDYLLEEIGSIIEARRLTTFEAYRDARRQGRRVALSESQRMLVWTLRDAFNQELKRVAKTTFHQVRAYAAQLVEQGHGPPKYDAVIVDEAQDLDPSVLWILASLAKSPNRVFLTADADQSIYGSGFRWTDVHDQLKFKGRTGVLRANFRSTREVGEAARAYIGEGTLEEEPAPTEYVHSGPLPVVRHVSTRAGQADLLVRFFRDAARELRLPIWAGAVLAPTEKAGELIAAELSASGIPARFMSGRELDLGAQAVKVITLRSAKGLEFPSVALAGFEDPYPFVRRDAGEEEKIERTIQERRTLFVGMTRAMRALLLCVPETTSSSLLAGFSNELWNADRPAPIADESAM